MRIFSKFILASAAILLVAAPASAGMVIVGGAGLVTVPTINNFKTDLSGIGLTQLYSGGGDVKAVVDGVIEFYYHAAESGQVDRFETGTATLVSGSSSFPDAGNPLDPWNASGTFIAKIKILAGQTFSSQAIGFMMLNKASTIGIAGNAGFGIFADGTGSVGSQNVLYFGFDDNPFAADDNHDDMVVSAHFTPVPEPASMAVWALGVFGAMVIRRRRQNKMTA